MHVRERMCHRCVWVGEVGEKGDADDGEAVVLLLLLDCLYLIERALDMKSVLLG